jgi:hypothetical protein
MKMTLKKNSQKQLKESLIGNLPKGKETSKLLEGNRKINKRNHPLNDISY